MKKRTKFTILFFTTITLFLVVASETFNFPSNITFYLNRTSREQILVESSGNKWLYLKDISLDHLQQSLDTLYSSDAVTVQQLRFFREPTSFLQRINADCNKSLLNVIEFSPSSVDIDVYFEKAFNPTTVKDIARENDLHFAINSNYFTPNNRPLGQIIKNGVEVNDRVSSWKGYFFKKESQYYFGPQSLLNETEGDPETLVQAMPTLMKNGVVFPYITEESNEYFNSQIISYRSLGGIKADGTIIFVVSGRGGTLSISELGIVAQKLGIEHATLFDGGKPLQYQFRHADFAFSFHAFNTWIELPYEKASRQQPPVYLGLRITD